METIMTYRDLTILMATLKIIKGFYVLIFVSYNLSGTVTHLWIQLCRYRGRYFQ